MLAKERQNKILSMLQSNGAVTVANLIKILMYRLKRYVVIFCVWKKRGFSAECMAARLRQEAE